MFVIPPPLARAARIASPEAKLTAGFLPSISLTKSERIKPNYKAEKTSRARAASDADLKRSTAIPRDFPLGLFS